MSKAWQRLAAAVVLVLSASFVVLAQQTPEQPQQTPGQSAGPAFRVTTQLVVLDVVVTDKHGNLVDRPLTQEDFEVLDAGRPQHIRHFETPDQHKMPDSSGKPIVNSAADLTKIGDAPVTILVLDELNSRFEDMSYSRQMMVKYLRTQPAVLPQPTVLMVASNTTFQQIHDYTQDRDALIQIVRKHMPEFPYKANQRNGPAAVERMAQVLAALTQLAEASTGTPGRKNLVWVGNGFPSANLVGMDDESVAKIERAIKRVTSRLLAARITMYSINPSPGSSATVDIESPDDLSLASDEYGNDPFDSGTLSFSNLAPSTGGIAFTGRNDIENLIGEGIAKGRDYYTLSYTPTSLIDAKSPYRAVKIRMKDPNLRATTRSGYYANSETDLNPLMDKTLTQKQMAASLRLDLSQALTTTISYNGLAVTAEKSGEAYIVHVAETGIGWSDPSPDGKQRAEATIAAAWYDAKNKILGHVIREEVYPRAEGAAGATYTLPVTMTPNSRRLRIVVRDARNGKMGTVDITKF